MADKMSAREGWSQPPRESVGEVTERQHKIIYVDVVVNGGVTDDGEAEYVLTVNTRIVKRMTYSQARRMGLFRD